MLDCAKFPQDNDMCITAQSVRQGNKEEGNSRGDDDDDGGNDGSGKGGDDDDDKRGQQGDLFDYHKSIECFGKGLGEVQEGPDLV